MENTTHPAGDRRHFPDTSDEAAFIWPALLRIEAFAGAMEAKRPVEIEPAAAHRAFQSIAAIAASANTAGAALGEAALQLREAAAGLIGFLADPATDGTVDFRAAHVQRLRRALAEFERLSPTTGLSAVGRVR